MKTKNVKKVLKNVIIYEGIALATFVPPVARFVGNINRSVQAGISEVGGIATNMYNVATRHSFGFSNLYFLALLFIAIGLPILDIILREKGSEIK